MNNFYNLDSKDVLEHFKVNKEEGLDGHKVTNRRQLFGLNELESKKRLNPIILFLNQFKSFIIYILLFAVVVSILAKEYIDSAVILAILLFNAFFGFIQEYRAEKSIEALKKLSSPKSRVLRGGKIVMIDSKDLVPGDILVLEEGDKISADARIIENINLQTLESSLTGESNPISKTDGALNGIVPLAERKNMVFSGTAITRGRGKAVVTSIGMKTEIGKIAGMITKVEDEATPLQKKLERLGHWIGMATIGICIIIFISGILKDGSINFLLAGNYIDFLLDAKEWLLTAVALAVAAVPEGLPAIVTISLALGVRRMIKRNALIRKLPSVETLGETTVICSDKTGTLTMNEMTVRKAFVNGKEIEIGGECHELNGEIKCDGLDLNEKDLFLFKIGALCNNSTLNVEGHKIIGTGDPTETALIISAEKAGIDYNELRKSWARTKEEPFDSERKMMSTINKDPKTNKELVFTKGAPEQVLERCNKVLINNRVIRLTPSLKKEILEKNEIFSSQALRVLGFAYKQYSKGKIEEDLIFVGLQGMIDPPRPEVKEALQRCKEAGIRVIMITGDNQHTAEAIAKEIGIEGTSINGTDFASMPEDEQRKSLETISIFSRVDPSHKMLIVNLLQDKGNVIVAMTGDGVNDAPALKKADIGIAMGIKGTDVAKEASDMVLQDDNFASIVNSVEEGRGVYENITKFVNYLLSSNLAEVLIIFLAVILGWPLPMTAVMLLWLNLVTDGLPALALGVDNNSKDLMKKPPRKAKEGIMNRSMMFNILYVSSLITLAVLGLFYWGMVHYSILEHNEMIMKIQTLAFTAIIVMELVRLQAIRSEYKLGPFSNKYLVLAVAASMALQLSVIYTPLSTFFGTVPLNLTDWGMIMAVTFGVLVLTAIGIHFKNKIQYFKE